MELTLFNTLGRELQVFTPLSDKKVGFYGCGPTVYNYAHIGNLRAYVCHDILVKTLRLFGYDVKHVMNITDVGHLSGDDDSGEDKMLKSAEERGKSVLEVAAFYTDAFFRDTDRLNIIKPTISCKATEHIGDMIALIKRIEAGGYTYSSGGNLYFDISKFPDYGKMAGLKLDDQRSGARVELDQNKRNPQDFALWFTRSKFENQALVWDSPWGKGYPGWHIECSAMSMKYLGESFDIHAGGIDHIPIHHTNEIAQSEAATGKPWVRYWMHNEFLVMDKGKMSKSKGGFITLQTLVDAGYHPLDYRYFLLGGHYRSQLQFSYNALDSARNARRALNERIRSIAAKSSFTAEELSEMALNASDTDKITGILQRAETAAHTEAFIKALQEDLSTPRALAELWALLKNTDIQADLALPAAFLMDTVLSLNLAEEAVQAKQQTKADPQLAKEVEELIQQRAEAKKARDFSKADAIRDTLKERGIILEDGPDGTAWKIL